MGLIGYRGDVKVCAILPCALWAFATAALEPAFVLPGAIRIEDRGGGLQTVTLDSGAFARVQTIRDGYSVTYSDDRPAERWVRTATGYSVVRLRPATSDYTRNVRGAVAERASGARVTVTQTRNGLSMREDVGAAARWTQTREGWTATALSR